MRCIEHAGTFFDISHLRLSALVLLACDGPLIQLVFVVSQKMIIGLTRRRARQSGTYPKSYWSIAEHFPERPKGVCQGNNRMPGVFPGIYLPPLNCAWLYSNDESALRESLREG